MPRIAGGIVSKGEFYRQADVQLFRKDRGRAKGIFSLDRTTLSSNHRL